MNLYESYRNNLNNFEEVHIDSDELKKRFIEYCKGKIDSSLGYEVYYLDPESVDPEEPDYYDCRVFDVQYLDENNMPVGVEEADYGLANMHVLTKQALKKNDYKHPYIGVFDESRAITDIEAEFLLTHKINKISKIEYDAILDSWEDLEFALVAEEVIKDGKNLVF